MLNILNILFFLNQFLNIKVNLGYQLKSGELLKRGDRLQSQNGKYALRMQNDGDLVLTFNNFEVSQISVDRGDRLEMGKDGNLVVYDEKNRLVWQSRTSGEGNYAEIQDDANVVIFDSNMNKIWSYGSIRS